MVYRCQKCQQRFAYVSKKISKCNCGGSIQVAKTFHPHCKLCSKEIEGRRSNARFCSTKCKAKYYKVYLFNPNMRKRTFWLYDQQFTRQDLITIRVACKKMEEYEIAGRLAKALRLDL